MQRREGLEAITLPNESGPPITLRPTFEVWRQVESKYGTVGQLFSDFKNMRPNVSMFHDLLYKCAKAAGYEENYQEFGERLYNIGIYTVYGIVGEVFADLFKEPDPGSGSAPGEVQEKRGPLA